MSSISHFSDVSINVFDNLKERFLKDPKCFAEYITGLTDELRQIGLLEIKDTFEKMDDFLRNSGRRKTYWYIVKKDPRTLTTTLGGLTFKRTLFKSKKTGKSCYLLDQILGLDPHDRLAEDAEARMLDEASQTSYRRGGEGVSITKDCGISKTAVMDRLHRLSFPRMWEPQTEKKKVRFLYIEADEDHVALQYKEHKGDLTKNANGTKSNCLMTKLVYVHEGVEPDAPGSKRYYLINPFFFSRGDEMSNDMFWDEVYQYVIDTYDIDSIEHIYLGADGGNWIKAGYKRLNGVQYVLDEFHIGKYLTKLTGHMKDSADEARTELVDALRDGTKDDFRAVVQKLHDALPDDNESGHKRVTNAADYFLNNWAAAQRRLKHRLGIIGCSAEGHVSHVLSDRMSSRPMGWCRTGADRMAQLRAYRQNKGSMLELVRYQKRELPKAAGDEGEVIYSAADMIQAENAAYNKNGKYIDSLQATASESLETSYWYHGLLDMINVI